MPPAPAIDYTHPHAGKILQEALTVLEHSETASRLMEQLPLSSCDLRIFKTIHPRLFVPDDNSAYIGLPATQDYTDIEQIVDLAAALLEIKWRREGNTRPNNDPQTEETLQKQHLINLELMLDTFPIVEELDISGYKAVDCLRKQGLSPLYRAWLSRAPYEDFINLYWSML